MSTPPATQVTITEEVTDLTVTNTNAIAVTLTTEDVSVSINNFAIPVNFMDAANVVFAGHNTISANNVSDALKQLADQFKMKHYVPRNSQSSEHHDALFIPECRHSLHPL